MKYNQWMLIILAGLLFTLNACDKSEENKTNSSSASSKSTPKGLISEEAYILNKKRPDSKVFANYVLQLFKELKDYFIFANPLNAKDKINQQGLKACYQHLHEDQFPRSFHDLLICSRGPHAFHGLEKDLMQ